MPKRLTILVVEDDRSLREFLRSVLEAEGYICRVAPDSQAAETILQQAHCDVALLDIYLAGESGLELLKRLKRLQPDCECVMMTARASLETVTTSIADGALEYLGKPILISDLLALLRRIYDRLKPQAREEPTEQQPESAIIGNGPKMLEVYRAIARVAPTDATVLITGPSGAGKELVARAIHEHSKRSRMSFTAINCAALPETILESELFGHEKGAFTGAVNLGRGLFETSKGGTLFLDEIGETSPGFQVKILRVLQEKEIRRLGSSTSIPVDVRILAATNSDLPAMVRQKKFRDDLYYRLSVIQIAVPSLAERLEDLPLLVRHFLDKFNRTNQRQVQIRKEAVEQLTRMEWPGNVRELENFIERAAIFSRTGEITADDIGSLSARLSVGAQEEALRTPQAETLRDKEKEQILRVLRDTRGNRSLAARRLGIERKTLYKKARRLGIDLGTKTHE
jgi:DNA-binding NtrC family response regulator